MVEFPRTLVDPSPGPGRWEFPVSVESPDEQPEPPPWSGRIRMGVAGVIGVGLLGLALTAGGVILSTLGGTEVVNADIAVTPSGSSDSELEGERESQLDGVYPEADVSSLPGTPAPSLIVHVVGAVGRAGIVEVPAGSRVVDALEAAGGVTEDADTTAVNLARTLIDGEQLVIPRMGEEMPPAAIGSVAAPPAGKISLSLADQATLDTLPGVGPALAERIIAWRERHGPFQAVTDVLAVSGIGPATLERFAHLVVP